MESKTMTDDGERDLAEAYEIEDHIARLDAEGDAISRAFDEEAEERYAHEGDDLTDPRD